MIHAGKAPVEIAAPEPSVSSDGRRSTEFASAGAGAAAGSSSSQSSTSAEGIRFELYIMSKCPFATKVLQSLDLVLAGLGDHVDLQVDYIGTVEDGVPTSMHGESEVDGDILHLCAADQGSRDQWREFVVCLADDYRTIPRDWEHCAERADLDLGRMSTCFDGPRGRELIEASFEKSRLRKATGSPTMFLAGEPYRGIRSASAFGRAICAALEDAKPAYCDDISVPVSVPVTVIGDRRCGGERGCDPKRFIAFVTYTFEGADVRELDYGDREGRKLFAESEEQFLPIAIFGPEVEDDKEGYDRLKQRLRRYPGTNDWIYPLGRNWDPTAEICDDGEDNTGDGKVDCRDATCKDKKVCRRELKGKLQLFMMSQCPYANRVLAAVDDVLGRFGKKRRLIDFSLEFIGNNEGGELTSMHGQGEVDEDLRMICAQQHYAKDYLFMDYVLCRSEAFFVNRHVEEQDAWKECATGGVDARVIEKCSEGAEGRRLLAASFALAEHLRATGSPTWLLNNKHDMAGREADAIHDAFCERNKKIKGCK